MQEQTEEQKDHFSPDRNHWCIVRYVKGTPLYYQGYFAASNKDMFDAPTMHLPLKPAFGIDFNDAAKFHSKIAAEFVFQNLQRYSKDAVKDC
jgi:hypothetical protein